MAERTTCQSCCPKCGLHFAGDSAFDLHCGGPKADPPWSHHDPRDVTHRDGSPALIVKTRDGTCRMVVDAPVHPVTIWQRAAGMEAAARMVERRVAIESAGSAP